MGAGSRSGLPTREGSRDEDETRRTSVQRQGGHAANRAASQGLWGLVLLTNVRAGLPGTH